MTKRLFVTGTDTGVGKTTVACALAAAWRRRGHRVVTMKPVETGCAPGADGPYPADARLLSDAASQQLPIDLVCPYRFLLAASPEAAAAASDATIDVATIVRAFAALQHDADVLIVEGAGGLLAPVAAGITIADVALRLAAPVLVVARASLGTINHTLLTVEAARRRDLAVAGVVLNRVLPSSGPDEPTNARAIERHGSVSVLGTLPHAPTLPPGAARWAELAELAERHLDLQGLWNAL